MIGIDSSVGHFHGQPAANGIKTPKVVVAPQKIVPTLSQLFLLHTARLFLHIRTSKVPSDGLLKTGSAMEADDMLTRPFKSTPNASHETCKKSLQKNSLVDGFLDN